MIKLLTVIGARPQFIKAAAISRTIKETYSDQIHEILLHTGQHYDPNMSNVFFEELEIPKEKYNLQIGSGDHSDQTARMMIKIDQVAKEEKPDAILLYGDTNSTLAACLVGIKSHIPIIHIEAGVRSYNKSFPEEVNRLVCDHSSSLLFVPSDAGIKSLIKEGFPKEETSNPILSPDNPKVFRCGDIMYDNTIYFSNKAKNRKDSVFSRYNLPEKDYILATMHRPSNVDKKETIESILKSFHHISNTHEKSIILPIHPRTKKKLEQIEEVSSLIKNERLHIIPAVSFLDMILLESNADLIITDSGGVQKEAYFVEKPCLIMLEETPWTELIETETAILVGSNFDKICEGADLFLTGKTQLDFPKIYGDGNASEFICKQIVKNISK